MYSQAVEHVIETAVKKKAQMEESLGRYFVSTMLAGLYVGIGIALIIVIGAPLAAVHSPFQNMIMGMSFGIALTLVVFAGADLFTGNNMYFTMSSLSGITTVKDTLKNWVVVFVGNLSGALVLSLLVIGSGIFGHIEPDHLIFTLATKKMTLTTGELFFRGILCNILVCLSMWMCNRAQNEIAKIVLIWWCLFAFITLGFEHCVANMTLLSLAYFLPHHPETITLGGWIHNMIPVTLGNIVGGTVFVGMAYWFLSGEKKQKTKKIS